MRKHYFFLLFFAFFAHAQQGGSEAAEEERVKPPAFPVTELGNDYHNSIKLLQNRFRIDEGVTEITLIFFREYGSSPVVLVKPDGSKVFQGIADERDVQWYETETYDMITIKEPVPGPWQAVGQILPGSRVMVVSDLELHAQALPDILFSGEILKKTAKLTNGGVAINYAEFRDVVGISVAVGSTNNPDFTNFGASDVRIATFEDNGRGMDERALDGVFTGQFNLAVPPGEWKPVYTVSTPMFTREKIGEALMILGNPINVEALVGGGQDGYHKLVIDAEREHVDINSLIIDGKVRFPNGDIQNFSLTETSDGAREHLLVNYEFGVFRVKLTAFGKTKTGRDFILDVPEYTFLVEEPEPEVAEPTEDMADEGEMDGSDMALSDMEEAEPEMATSTLIMIIVGGNLGVLLLGFGLIWFFVLRNKSDKSSQDSKESASEDKVKSNEQKDDDMIDLSMPE